MTIEYNIFDLYDDLQIAKEEIFIAEQRIRHHKHYKIFKKYVEERISDPIFCFDLNKICRDVSLENNEDLICIESPGGSELKFTRKELLEYFKSEENKEAG